MAYKTIDEKFWTDPKIKQLKPLERYLMLYLITNPHAHYCGLYYIPVALIIEETGLDKKVIDASILIFQKLEIIAYDQTCSTIWIINMLHYQNCQGGNPARIKQGIESQLKTIHSFTLIETFIEKYQILNLTLPQGYRKVKVTLPQPSSSVTVSSSVTDTGTGTKEIKEYPDEFERFWTAYPKKVGKAGALKSWDKLDFQNGLLEKIFLTLEKQKNSDDWLKNKGQYIPHPTTWLNQGRWDDEVEVDEWH